MVPTTTIHTTHLDIAAKKESCTSAKWSSSRWAEGSVREHCEHECLPGRKKNNKGHTNSQLIILEKVSKFYYFSSVDSLVHGAVMSLKVDQEGEGGRALGRRTGELGVRRVQELLLIFLRQVDALPDGAHGVPVGEERLRRHPEPRAEPGQVRPRVEGGHRRRRR